MGKASISIGVDDATGQPASGPEGPYITDEDDGSRPRRRKRSRLAPKANRGESGGKRSTTAQTDEGLAGRRKGPAQP
jgi:hypothetical protein